MIIINNIKTMAYSALFAAFMAILSFIYIPSAVPITLQTFGVFSALLILGDKWGSASVAIYILLGLAGLPVFSGLRGGISAFLSPTGGYILGLLIICLTFLGLNKLLKGKFKLLSLLAGLVFCYIFGSIWYLLYVKEDSIWAVLTVCVLPFIIPDILKLIAASILAKKVKRIINEK